MTSSPMTFAPSTPGAVRNALTTSRNAIVEELAGLQAPSDQMAYLRQLGLWCSREAAGGSEGQGAGAEAQTTTA